MFVLYYLIQCFCQIIGVIDMGSTGTRLNIYEFNGQKIVKALNYENIPGLSDLQDSQIELKLGDLLQRAKKNVPDVNLIPIGVYGTAGLRGISLKEVNHKLKFIKTLLRNYNIVECKVLSGIEEGEMAFNSLIYLKQILENRQMSNLVLKFFEKISKKIFKKIERRHYALIDMGGKSVQIVYDKNNNRIHKSYVAGHKEGTIQIANLDCTIFRNTCIRRVAEKLSILKKDLELNNKTIYLSSYFYDVIRKNFYKTFVSLNDLNKIFDDRCNDLRSKECKDLFYVVGFLSEIGISPYKKMHLIGYIEGIRFNWTIGKSYQLLKRLRKESYLRQK